MPKYRGISPEDNEKGTLGTAKKRWEKLYVKEIESDTVSGMAAEIENLATTAENSVSAAVSAKNDAVSAKQAAEAAQTAAETAAAGIQSVAETDVDNTLTIPGVAADAKVTGDWLRDIAKPVTLDTSLPATAYADEYMKVTVDSDNRVLYGVKRDGTFTWQKGVPKHLQDKINELAAPTIDNDEYMYVMLDSEGHILFGVKKDGSFDWQKGLPKPVKEFAQPVIQSDEFIQLTQDAEGKLIEGIQKDGAKVFFSDVKFRGGVSLPNKQGDENFYFANYEKHYVANSLYVGLPIFRLNGNTVGMSKENKVNLSFDYNGVSGTCTCKWQGSSSQAYPKKNYTIAKLSPAIDVGWGSHKKYVLKANYIDPSHSRNIVSAKLWGEIVKSRNPVNARLSALVNGGAIDGFPVMLVINDKYQGIYTLNIPKDDWLLGMGSGEYEAIISGEVNNTRPTGFKENVTYDDVLNEKYFSIEYVPDEDNPYWAIDGLNELITAAINSTGSNYRSTLEPYLDIESAIDYYIFSCLIGNHDGMGKNLLISTYDGSKWFFTPYDLDSTFGNYWDGSKFLAAKTTNPTFATFSSLSRIMYLIHTYDKATLKSRYSDLRNSVLSEDNVLLQFANYMTNIPKALKDEEVKIWRYLPETGIDALTQIANWYKIRAKYMDDEIALL